VTAGDLYFVAGQLALDTRGNVVGKGDFEAQFQQVFENMSLVLSGLNVTFNHVAKFTIYFVHSQHIERSKGLRAELFPRIFIGGKFPPNTICVIDRLVREESLFEVEAVVRGEG
jgi:enamine deaminase RidA (YjgF/YER057c/UK114 family)